MAAFGDWRDTRAALQAAYAAIGEDHPGSLPERDWKLAKAFQAALIPQVELTCVECERPILYREEITCLDCGAPLHKVCAPRHFWPSGRPKNA